MYNTEFALVIPSKLNTEFCSNGPFRYVNKKRKMTNVWNNIQNIPEYSTCQSVEKSIVYYFSHKAGAFCFKPGGWIAFA